MSLFQNILLSMAVQMLITPALWGTEPERSLGLVNHQSTYAVRDPGSIEENGN